MANEKNKPVPKETVLKELRSLNPRPKSVTCEFFRKDSFFDSRDLVQVKYEMLRQVDKEGVSIAHASKEFGMSRPAFYQAKADFEVGGLPALVGQKRGPRKPHKINEEILSFIEREVTTSGITSSALLAGAVEKTFKVKVHPRSIERALGSGNK